MIIIKVLLFLIFATVITFLGISIVILISAMLAGVLRIVIFLKVHGYRDTFGRKIYPTTGTRILGLSENRVEKILFVFMLILFSLPFLYLLFRIWFWLF
jgi:hypothetical protein